MRRRYLSTHIAVRLEVELVESHDREDAKVHAPGAEAT